MKLQAPEGMTGFSHDGVPVEMDEKGVAEVTNNPALVSRMRDHGFTDVVTTEAKADKKAAK